MILRFLPLSSLFLALLAWSLATTVHASSSSKGEEEKQGAILFRDKGCTFCHGVGAVGTKKAPALDDLWKDKSWTDDKLADRILNGGQKMPPFRDSVTDEEVGELIAYLRAKTKPVPPPATDDTPPAAPPQ